MVASDLTITHLYSLFIISAKKCSELGGEEIRLLLLFRDICRNVSDI